jgi:hypothetical protein
MLFLEATQNKKGPPHVCQGNDFDLYVVVVLVGFVCCCCCSSSWILYVVVVVVALWCSKSPYNERDWQIATTAMAPGKFYAVRCGYIPGIYETWVACQQQVRGYKGSQFKSFKSRLEAEQYLSSPGSSGQAATIRNVSVLESPQSSVRKRPRSRSPPETQPLSRNQVSSSFQKIEKKASSFVIYQPCTGAIFLSQCQEAHQWRLEPKYLL